MPQTSANYDFVLTAADGVTEIPLMLVGEVDRAGVARPKRVAEALAASNADSPLADWLEPVSQEDWSRGVGLDYAEAPGVYTRTPGMFLPAGFATDVTVPAVGNSDSRIIKILEFGGDVWFAQEGILGAANGRMLRSVGGTAAPATSMTVTGSDIIYDMVAFNDQTNTPALWVGCGLHLRKWDGAVWTTSALLPNSRNYLAKVYWVTSDGVGAPRMVAVTNFSELGYTLPGADPLLAAQWVTGIDVGTTYGIKSLVGSRRHVYALAADGVFDLDEQGNAPNLVPYLESTLTSTSLAAVPATYLEGYLYYGSAAGLDRVWVGDGPQLNETPGICSPGWGTETEHRWRGMTTCLAVEQGWIVNAVWNPTTGRSGIFWGRDRRLLGIESPNPVIWYGPEIWTDENWLVTAVCPVWRGSQLRLWVAARNNAGGTPSLAHVSLPLAGSPMDDLASAGGHKFATGTKSSIWQPSCEVWSLSETWRDKVATKFLYEHTIGSRGLGTPDANTKAELYLRADPLPGSTAWGTATNITQSPNQTVTPSTPNQGTKLQWMLKLFNPQGNAATPQVGLIDAVRRTAWRVVPTIRVKVLEVEYGDDVTGIHGGRDDALSPERIKDLLEELTETNRTTLRDRLDQRWSVHLRQVLDSEDTYTETGPHGLRTRSRLVVGILGPAA